jgi:hypothetical protein
VSPPDSEAFVPASILARSESGESCNKRCRRAANSALGCGSRAAAFFSGKGDSIFESKFENHGPSYSAGPPSGRDVR